MTAFKQESVAASNPPVFFFVPTLDQFAAVLSNGAGASFLNSLIATGVSTVLVILLAVPASDALSIRPVQKTQDVLFFFISTKMLPVVAVVTPIYVIAGQIKALDNIWTLVVLYTAMNLPIAVRMMRSFFQEVPAEVLEAASMDGAGLIKTLSAILMPMVTPGLAANAATVPVFLVSQMISEGQFLAKLSAASVLASLPVVIAGRPAQKQLVHGLSMGAEK